MKEIQIDKHPIVNVNPGLNKYTNVVLFPKRLAEANETLKRVELPKELQQKTLKK